MPSTDSKVRSNKQVWRLAKYLRSRIAIPLIESYSNGMDVEAWGDEYEYIKNHYYDEAAELLKKIQMNEFTGEDNHE